MQQILPAFKTAFVFIAILFAMNSTPGKTQQVSNSNPEHATAGVIRYEVKPDYNQAFRKALSEYVLYSLNSEPNIMCEAYYEQDSAVTLWLTERWNSRSDLDKAHETVAYKTLQSVAENALVRPSTIIYIKDLEPLSKQEWRRLPGKKDDPLIIMLFVDAKAGTENNFKSVYHAAMPKFRSEPGVINYQLSQLEADSTRFVTYEKFRNEEGFQYHLQFPPIQPVIDYLNTSIKQQPFQAGLHRLIAFAPEKR